MFSFPESLGYGQDHTGAQGIGDGWEWGGITSISGSQQTPGPQHPSEQSWD